MPFATEVGLRPSDIVLDGDPAPLPKERNPQFSAHVSCGQTAGWIKMPLGTELCLGPNDIVLDWEPSSSQRGTLPPISGRCLLWLNGRPSQLLLSTYPFSPRLHQNPVG